MKTRKTVKILSFILSLVLMSTMMTGYVFANEIKASSDAKISGTATGSSISADQNKISVASAKISIKNASVTGVKDKNWTGKVIKQIPVVRVKGRTLKRGTDYTVAYYNNKNVGTSKVVIKGKGKYTGTVTKSFYIKPRGTTITVLKRKGNRMTVKWKKVSDQVSGYQIACSGARLWKAKLSHAQKIDVPNKNTLSKTIAIYAENLRYKLWIRTYKKVGNKKYYSNWSGAISIWRSGHIEHD